MNKSKPELLSPAGNWASLRASVEAGADSVYFGIKGINMRHLANNFDILEIKKVMNFLKEHNCKGYLTLNTIILNEEINKVQKILLEAKKASVDAIILWDLAVLSMAQDLGLRVHLSTQASVSNIEALKVFVKMGVERIVLARECQLTDIRTIISQIRNQGIQCEIETFIHGAMCVAISGRCFLSQYSFDKSANKGQCLQPCRREFFIRDKEGETEYIIGEDYILSPRDLCALDFMDELIEAGIHSFKIEGRMRSPEYSKVTTRVYREAIDAYYSGTFNRQRRQDLKERLSEVFNRGFSSGFYFGKPTVPSSKGLEHSYEKVFLGNVTRIFKRINVAEISVMAGELNVGDQLLFIGKNTVTDLVNVDEIQRNHQVVEKAAKGESIGMKLPFAVKPKDKVFLWRKKH